MDRIVLIGLNHKTAPVEIREKFAVVCVDTSGPLMNLGQMRALRESFYLSTCNRMEVLFTTPRLDEGISAVVGLLADIYGQTGSALKPYLYTYIDQWWWANLRYSARSKTLTAKLRRQKHPG